MILKERPEIDALVGVFGRDEIVSIADRLRGAWRSSGRCFGPLLSERCRTTERR
jgi:ribosomal protein S12 methylthiotransferase